ncbi:hypothetical protein [Ohtaekwangia sp.]|uniref:hypothetical protein n=1 Tax=Ohtaekwangia sp. TaxID=2066019 RepID=UPI002FDD0BBA
MMDIEKLDLTILEEEELVVTNGGYGYYPGYSSQKDSESFSIGIAFFKGIIDGILA